MTAAGRCATTRRSPSTACWRRCCADSVDDPKDKTFTPFGDARHKLDTGEVVTSREMYFAVYWALADDENRAGLYRQFPPGFFDLIVVDECHRGSARADSVWREIPTYFAPAFQLGVTATPLRDESRDAYAYFGNPVYTYSLRQGIDDGFLAPYRVHRSVTDVNNRRTGEILPDTPALTHHLDHFAAPPLPTPAPQPSANNRNASFPQHLLAG